MFKRHDFDTPPTVVGMIVGAWKGGEGEPDVLHVHGTDVARDIGNLLRVIDDPVHPDPCRPFSLVGLNGTIRLHGYTDKARLIGKYCLIYSGGRFDQVAIEPEEGDHWGLVTWAQYF